MGILVTMDEQDPPHDEPAEPESKAPAPGSLALLQEFINSVELPDGVDELGTETLASAWLQAKAGMVLPVSASDLRRLVATRETLRDLLEAHTGENVDPAVAVRLEKLLSHAPLRPVLSTSGATLAVDCGGVDRFLGMVSTAIVEATLMSTWARFKVCRSSSCRWAYYDHSKNGSGAWCSMRSCGSREKARAYRARRRSAAAAQGA